MRRWLLATLAILALAAVACGGDDDDANGGTGTPGRTGTPGANETPGPTSDGTSEPTNGDGSPTPFPTNTPLPELPTPTPVPDDTPTMSVRYGSNMYDPTPAQFSALATTTVSGLSGEGVLLSTLAAEVGAPEGALVTFRGYIPGQGTQRFIRDTLTALGSTTILVLGSDGHISVQSTAVDQADWLQSVEEIIFE